MSQMTTNIPNAQGEWTQGTMRVISQADKYAADRSKYEVTIESSARPYSAAIEELRSAAARNLAIGYAAAHGCNNAGINGNVNVFAVNSEGEDIGAVRDPHGQVPPVNHPRRQMAAYRAVITVLRNALR